MLMYCILYYTILRRAGDARTRADAHILYTLLYYTTKGRGRGHTGRCYQYDDAAVARARDMRVYCILDTWYLILAAAGAKRYEPLDTYRRTARIGARVCINSGFRFHLPRLYDPVQYTIWSGVCLVGVCLFLAVTYTWQVNANMRMASAEKVLLVACRV